MRWKAATDRWCNDPDVRRRLLRNPDGRCSDLGVGGVCARFYHITPIWAWSSWARKCMAGACAAEGHIEDSALAPGQRLALFVLVLRVEEMPFNTGYFG